MNIIGKSECSAEQMAQYLISKNPSAKSWALEYAKLYIEEGNVEGVRGDGAWIQSCKETHYFIFDCGTAVTFDQNNFCGLGVTRKGVKGCCFSTPRLGIRAQIQHLKGYATSAPLKNSCIDPRYKYVQKGIAPTFELLAGKWAIPGYDTSKASSLQDAMNKKIGYGFDIISSIETMKRINTKGGSPMGYVMKTNLANRANYGAMRNTSKIKYIVIHYTANDGDSDEANGNYFHNKVVKASAHYFVDDDSITQSVPDNYVAYSVGDKRYSDYKATGGAKFYGKCTNANSISIEMCDTKKDGIHNVTEATINNTIELVKILMKKYNVTIDRVVRHFDISGKRCPSYFVNESEWQKFKNKITPSSSIASLSTSPTFYMYGSEPKSIITGNANQFTQIVQNIKTVLNKDYGLKFAINGIVDDTLLINLGNIVMSTSSYNKNLTYCLQQLFVWWNVNLTIDGLFGSATRTNIMNFQKIWNIVQTGTTTKEFWYKILGK